MHHSIHCLDFESPDPEEPFESIFDGGFERTEEEERLHQEDLAIFEEDRREGERRNLLYQEVKK
jgi:hypothetical protein